MPDLRSSAPSSQRRWCARGTPSPNWAQGQRFTRHDDVGSPAWAAKECGRSVFPDVHPRSESGAPGQARGGPHTRRALIGSYCALLSLNEPRLLDSRLVRPIVCGFDTQPIGPFVPS